MFNRPIMQKILTISDFWLVVDFSLPAPHRLPDHPHSQQGLHVLSIITRLAIHKFKLSTSNSTSKYVRGMWATLCQRLFSSSSSSFAYPLCYCIDGCLPLLCPESGYTYQEIVDPFL